MDLELRIDFVPAEQGEKNDVVLNTMCGGEDNQML